MPPPQMQQMPPPGGPGMVPYQPPGSAPQPVAPPNTSQFQPNSGQFQPTSGPLQPGMQNPVGPVPPPNTMNMAAPVPPPAWSTANMSQMNTNPTQSMALGMFI